MTDSRRRPLDEVNQLQLVLDAGVNAVHVSDVDVSRPGANSAQVLAVAERLGVPLRGRRPSSGGRTVPVYFYRSMLAPEIAPVRDVLEIILATFRPYPALVLDGNFDLVAANSGVALLTAGLPRELRRLPINFLRLNLHRDGLANRVVNLPEWSGYLRAMLDALAPGNSVLTALQEEIGGAAGPAETPDLPTGGMPLSIRSGAYELSFLATATVLSSSPSPDRALSIEALLPADAATARVLDELLDSNH